MPRRHRLSQNIPVGIVILYQLIHMTILLHHLENHLWIQGFSIPADDDSYANDAMALAVSQGINDLAVWGFDGHRAMSRLPANIRMKPGII